MVGFDSVVNSSISYAKSIKIPGSDNKKILTGRINKLKRDLKNFSTLWFDGEKFKTLEEFKNEDDNSGSSSEIDKWNKSPEEGILLHS